MSYGEWRQFLSQARGSLFEIDAQCIAANRLGFLPDNDMENVVRTLRLTGRALAGLIRWVKTEEQKVKRPERSATKQLSNSATR